MKRGAELTPLSHDHHQALFVALKLKRGEAGAGDAFAAFLDGDGREHFRAEEEILLPTWLALDPEADQQLARRVLADHLELHTWHARLRANEVDDTELAELGRLLEEHVRFEERTLFPAIEAALAGRGRALAELGERLQAEHR